MENLRGIFFMTVAMASFALEDLIIKILSKDMPVSQILISVGIVSVCLLIIIGKIQKIPILRSKDIQNPLIFFRTISDMLGAIFIVYAISLISLSTVSSFLQAIPLLVTAGSAIFFKEKVGWRRWSAIIVGFCGVILILKPGMNSFQSYSILAFIGIFFLGLRDLITRNVKSDISSLSISIYAFLATTIGGVLLIPISNSFVVLSSLQLYLILLSAVIASFSYFMLVLATRKGDISVISPFRYTRLLFALILAVFILGERPDIYTLVGATIIILSGCYTFWREYLIKKNKIYK